MGYSEWVGLNSIRLSWAEEIPETQLDKLIGCIRTVIDRRQMKRC